MTESAKMEILKALAFGDLGRAREIEESLREDESVPEWRRRPKYYYDENGNEYWYDKDGQQHYTRLEG